MKVSAYGVRCTPQSAYARHLGEEGQFRRRRGKRPLDMMGTGPWSMMRLFVPGVEAGKRRARVAGGTCGGRHGRRGSNLWVVHFPVNLAVERRVHSGRDSVVRDHVVTLRRGGVGTSQSLTNLGVSGYSRRSKKKKIIFPPKRS